MHPGFVLSHLLLCSVFAQSRVSSPPTAVPPAEVVASVSLAPRAGNGFQPTAMTIDTRRNRLLVFNNISRNISALDLRTGRIVKTAPLPLQQSPLNPPNCFAYDRLHDRVITVVRNAETTEGLLFVALRAGALTVLSTRSLPTMIGPEDGIVLDARRSELSFLTHMVSLEAPRRPGENSPMQSIQTCTALDSRTFRTRRKWTQNTGFPVAHAPDERRGDLLTAELLPSEPGGRPSGTSRIFLRAHADGRILTQSQRTFEHQITGLLPLPDERAVAVVAGDEIALLNVSNLRVRTTWRTNTFAGPSARFTPEVYANRHRLIATLNDGRVVSINLRAAGRSPTFLPMANRGLSLAGIASDSFVTDERTGNLYGIANNAVVFIDPRTRKEVWRSITGVDLGALFFDPSRNRLVASAISDRTRLRWFQVATKHGRLDFAETGVSEWPFSGHPQAIDFRREVIYGQVPSPSVSEPAAISFDGRSAEPPVGELILALFCARGEDQLYGLTFPRHTDFAQPRAEVDYYEGPKLIRSVSIGQMPTALAFAPGSGRLFLVREQSMTAMTGKPLTIQRPTSSSKELLGIYLDSDAAGSYLYYADALSSRVYRLALPSGHVTAVREIGFQPKALYFDQARGLLYLLDPRNARVVAVKSF